MIRYDFSNKLVLVTGSSRGIGAGILSGFAHAGANCILHYWNDPAGQNRADAEAFVQDHPQANVHLFAADVRNADEIATMMNDVQAKHGPLYSLVNNAGILRDRSLKKMTLEDWQDVLGTNLTGVFHTCKYGAEILSDGGRIVNIASVAGLVGYHGQSNYAAAKAGVIGMTRVLSKELARRQITVNAIAPGIVQTAMMGDIKPEVRDQYIQQIPLGRFGETADIANAVLFLSSEESSYITGQILPVTGGWV